MKCPCCGYEQPYVSIDDGRRYRDAVESRLVEYGFSKGMTPQKAQAATALRKIIAIRYGVVTKAGGSMLAGMADKGIAGLDEVLPPKGDKK